MMANYDSTNFVVQNNLAATSMLLKLNLPQAHALARELYAGHPEEGIIASTYAYSLHLQGRTKEGLAVLEKLKPETLELPPVALYYGLLTSAGGQPAKAGRYLGLAQKGELLPEEKALLQMKRPFLFVLSLPRGHGVSHAAEPLDAGRPATPCQRAIIFTASRSESPSRAINFIAVSQSGTVMTSSMASNWVTRVSGTNCDLFGVAYGTNSFNGPQLVAVGAKSRLARGKVWFRRTASTGHLLIRLRQILFTP